MDLDQDGQGRGLVDQEQRVRDHGAQLGWNVTRVIVENDVASADGKVRGVSAFKRRKVRLADGRSEWRTFLMIPEACCRRAHQKSFAEPLFGG